jgi:hypothetical protein
LALLAAEDQPGRESRQDIWSVGESQGRERGLRLARLHPDDHEVQV